MDGFRQRCVDCKFGMIGKEEVRVGVQCSGKVAAGVGEANIKVTVDVIQIMDVVVVSFGSFYEATNGTPLSRVWLAGAKVS